MQIHRQERVLSDKSSRNSGTAGVHRLRFWMGMVLALILLLAALLGVSVWKTLYAPDRGKPGVSSVSRAVKSEASSELPVPDDNWALMIVSPDRKISSSFTPQLTNFQNVQVDQRIVPALQKLFADASATGYSLKLVSGYVDENTQNQLYQKKIQELMQKSGKTRAVAESEAAAMVPPGGYSEDETGMAVTFPSDSAFLNSDAYHWLLNHCVDYGFVRRYTDEKEGRTGLKDNPSHFRYVGTDNAQTMRKLGLCLEEYVTYRSNQTAHS